MALVHTIFMSFLAGHIRALNQIARTGQSIKANGHQHFILKCVDELETVILTVLFEARAACVL